MTTDDKPHDRRPLDPDLDAAWRTLPDDEPSPALDAAIRAAARRAVGARPARVREATRPGRWWWPLAAAATIGAVTIGILQIGGEPGRRDPLRSEPAAVSDVTPQSTPSAQKPAPSATPQAPNAPVAEGPAKVAPPPAPAAPMTAPMKQPPPRVAPKPQDDATRDATAPTRKDTAAPGAADFAQTPPPSAPEAAARRETAATESRAQDVGRIERSPQDAAARAAAGAASAGAANPFPAAPAGVSPPPATTPMAPAPESSAPPPAARPREAFPAGGAANTSPSGQPKASALSAKKRAADESGTPSSTSLSTADWIARIRQLRADGRIAEAARELAAFRAAHPDPRELPLDLRDWRPPPPESESSAPR